MSVTNEAVATAVGGRTRRRTHHMEIRRDGLRSDGDWLYVWACVHCGRTLAQLDADAAPEDPTAPSASLCHAAA
ncbi:MAG: hypothetical protein ACT4QG_14240 [Sporichthyaceae bacterium]